MRDIIKITFIRTYDWFENDYHVRVDFYVENTFHIWLNYVQMMEKNHIVELTFRFVPISQLMYSKKKEETMLSKNHLDNSIIEIYTYKVSIVIKIATKIKNVPVLLSIPENCLCIMSFQESCLAFNLEFGIGQ